MLNNKGFSLVEVMISLVVMLILFMGMMQGTVVNIQANVLSDLREEAINIAQMEMSNAMNIPYDLLSTATDTVSKDYGKFTTDYAITRTVTSMGTYNKEVVVSVTWEWKTQSGNTSTRTYVRNPNP